MAGKEDKTVIPNPGNGFEDSDTDSESDDQEVWSKTKKDVDKLEEFSKPDFTKIKKAFRMIKIINIAKKV